MLFFRKDYSGALIKYEERLQYLCNMNNNAMLREIHGSIINCHLKLGSVDKAVVHVKEIVSIFICCIFVTIFLSLLSYDVLSQTKIAVLLHCRLL